MTDKKQVKRQLKMQIKKRVKTLIKQDYGTTAQIAQLVALECGVKKGFVLNIGNFKRG